MNSDIDKIKNHHNIPFGESGYGIKYNGIISYADNNIQLALAETLQMNRLVEDTSNTK